MKKIMVIILLPFWVKAQRFNTAWINNCRSCNGFLVKVFMDTDSVSSQGFSGKLRNGKITELNRWHNNELEWRGQYQYDSEWREIREVSFDPTLGKTVLPKRCLM